MRQLKFIAVSAVVSYVMLTLITFSPSPLDWTAGDRFGYCLFTFVGWAVGNLAAMIGEH